MLSKTVELAKLLVDRNIITQGMTISAKVSTTGFGHAVMTSVKQGVITKITSNGLNALFEDKKQRKTAYEDIIAIEGMDLERFAQAYCIKINNKKA
jgi:hypothetical protein